MQDGCLMKLDAVPGEMNQVILESILRDVSETIASPSAFEPEYIWFYKHYVESGMGFTVEDSAKQVRGRLNVIDLLILCRARVWVDGQGQLLFPTIFKATTRRPVLVGVDSSTISPIDIDQTDVLKSMWAIRSLLDFKYDNLCVVELRITEHDGAVAIVSHSIIGASASAHPVTRRVCTITKKAEVVWIFPAKELEEDEAEFSW